MVIALQERGAANGRRTAAMRVAAVRAKAPGARVCDIGNGVGGNAVNMPPPMPVPMRRQVHAHGGQGVAQHPLARPGVAGSSGNRSVSAAGVARMPMGACNVNRATPHHLHVGVKATAMYSRTSSPRRPDVAAGGSGGANGTPSARMRMVSASADPSAAARRIHPLHYTQRMRSSSPNRTAQAQPGCTSPQRMVTASPCRPVAMPAPGVRRSSKTLRVHPTPMASVSATASVAAARRSSDPRGEVAGTQQTAATVPAATVEASRRRHTLKTHPPPMRTVVLCPSAPRAARAAVQAAAVAAVLAAAVAPPATALSASASPRRVTVSASSSEGERDLDRTCSLADTTTSVGYHSAGEDEAAALRGGDSAAARPPPSVLARRTSRDDARRRSQTAWHSTEQLRQMKAFEALQQDIAARNSKSRMISKSLETSGQVPWSRSAQTAQHAKAAPVQRVTPVPA